MLLATAGQRNRNGRRQRQQQQISNFSSLNSMSDTLLCRVPRTPPATNPGHTARKHVSSYENNIFLAYLYIHENISLGRQVFHFNKIALFIFLFEDLKVFI